MKKTLSLWVKSIEGMKIEGDGIGRVPDTLLPIYAGKLVASNMSYALCLAYVRLSVRVGCREPFALELI